MVSYLSKNTTTYSNFRHSQKHLSYRPSIDGLRGVAVTCVLLYHLFPDVFPGGFIGVDIFFVISGFLISTIIFKKLDTGTFQCADFFSRRIRRIYPALIVVCGCCLLYGWLVLFHDEFRQLTKHLSGAAVFLTNVFLYKEAGYFDLASEFKPLLHLWSLAIEEQFYLCWPLLLLALYKFHQSVAQIMSRHTLLMGVMGALTLLSYLTYIYCYQMDKSFAFYFTGARLWELSVGALGAYYTLFFSHKESTFKSRPSISLVAVVVVILSVFFLNYDVPCFPLLLVLPVLASLVLLLNDAMGVMGQTVTMFLSSRFLVFLGLISYPVYLLHWPAISFHKIIDPNGFDFLSKLSILAMVVSGAYVIYRYVEQPIRKRGRGNDVRLLFLAMMCLGLIGLAGSLAWLKPKVAMSGDANLIAQAFYDWQYPTLGMQKFGFEGQTFYRIGQGKNEILFLGDSNLEQYGPRIEQLMHASKGSTSVVFATKGGLAPFPHVALNNSHRDMIQKAYAYAKNQNVKVVVIGGEWNGYFGGKMSQYLYNSSKGQGDLTEKHVVNWALEDLHMVVKDLVNQGKAVYLVASMPVGMQFNPKSYFRRNFEGITPVTPQHASRKTWDFYNKLPLHYLRSLLTGSGARLIDPTEFLCDQKVCLTHTEKGEVIYKDSAHLRASFVRHGIRYFDFLFTA